MPTSTATVTREDLNPCTIKLTVKCAPEQVQEGYAKAIKLYAKNVRIPGFRPGQAPKNVVEKMVPKEEISNQAAEEVIRKVLGDTLNSEKIQPHDAPMVNVTKLDMEKHECEFEAKVPLAPIVELGEYKGLPAVRPKIEITDEEVDEQIEELRKRAGKREAVLDRGAEDGDVAVVSIRLEGETGEGRKFMTAVGKTFEQLDAALRGMQAEEMKNMELTFPSSFQEKDWAGKTLKCQVTLRSINSVRLPNLGDEFAQELKGDLKSKSITDLQNKIREEIGAAKQLAATEFVNDSLQDELLKRSSVTVPDTMWESVANQRLREFSEEAQKQGKTLEDVAKESGMTLDEMVKEWQHAAEVQVKRAVLTKEVFVREKMQLTNEDLNQSLWAMAYDYQVKPEDLLEAMKKAKSFQELEIRAMLRKVSDLLNQHATITEADAPAPAKKSAPASESKPKKATPKK